MITLRPSHTFKEVECLDDTSRKLAIAQISNPDYSEMFKPNVTSNPQTAHLSLAYWYRIRINSGKTFEENRILEFRPNNKK